jgi:hypothetical protein
MMLSLDNTLDLNESENNDRNRFLEKIIKTNREIFIMSALMDKPMCGYDIIKEIFLKFNVFLGQAHFPQVGL